MLQIPSNRGHITVQYSCRLVFRENQNPTELSPTRHSNNFPLKVLFDFTLFLCFTTCNVLLRPTLYICVFCAVLTPGLLQSLVYKYNIFKSRPGFVGCTDKVVIPTMAQWVFALHSVLYVSECYSLISYGQNVSSPEEVIWM